MAKKKVRSKQNIPEDETKSARFVRVVKPRVSKAIKAIHVIGYCANTSYDYTPAQIKQIIDSLLVAIDAIDTRFKAKSPADNQFDFME